MISPEVLLRVAVITGLLAPFLPGPGGRGKSLAPGERVFLSLIRLEQKLTGGHECVSGAGGRDWGPAVTVCTS